MNENLNISNFLRFVLVALIVFSTTLLLHAQQGKRSDQSASVNFISVAQESQQFHTISVGGRLQPKNRIVHKSYSEGIIRSVAVEEGDFVETGDVLFKTGRKDDVEKVYEPFAVTARITGYVSEVLIQKDDEIEGGEEAVVILGNEGYVLKAYVSDKDASKLELGQEVTAITTREHEINGILTYRSREPDYDTGLFTLTFHFPESEQRYIGQFVIIDLPVDRESGIFVKRDIITRRYGAYYIWIVNGEQELEAREVILGPVYGDVVKINKGLETGERYLNRLTGREKEGSKVDESGT
jgi:multidrug efflux pump subunit AcrA (membrane-fusion protein)